LSQSNRPAPKAPVPPRGGKGGGRGGVPPRQGTKGRSPGGRPAASRPQSRSASGEARQAGWERRRAQRRQRNLFIALGAAVVLVVAALIIVKSFVGNGSSKPNQLPPGVAQQVSGVPVSEMVAAAQALPATGSGNGGVTAPGAIQGPASLGGTHPTVLYVGAEYCPFCAAERWPLVMALSKFGTFTGLQATTSSSTDTNPNTPTFTFVNASYSSPYLAFQSREQQNRLQQPLQKLTPEQNALVQKYDAPPYVPSSSAGSIPFILFGSQFVVSGSQYDGAPLANMSMTDASNALTASQTPNPSATGVAAASQSAKAVAGHLLGALCAITADKPPVCQQVPASLKPTGSTSGGQGSSGS
jgi:hypothetical protein